jgi:hypothetical protein
MISIKNSLAFKEDYARMQKDISEVTDENLKKELTSLLLTILKEVSAIDMHHDSISITGKLPDGIQESRNKIASIRKKIDAKLSSYKSQKHNHQA